MRFYVLSALIVVVFALWLFGLATSSSLGGFMPVLFGVAFITVLVRLLRGRHPLRG